MRKDCPEADQHSQPYKTLRDPHHFKYAVVIAYQNYQHYSFSQHRYAFLVLVQNSLRKEILSEKTLNVSQQVRSGMNHLIPGVACSILRHHCTQIFCRSCYLVLLIECRNHPMQEDLLYS